METLKDLKLKALKIEEPIEICWPTSDRLREIINPSDYRFCNSCYSAGSETIAFVSNNVLYVVPYLAKVEQILLREGLKKKHFYVPLSGGAYPVGRKEEWEEIQEKFKKVTKDRFEKCIEYADKKGYGEIEEDLIEQKCFEIPLEGIEVRRFDGSNFTHYPAIRYIQNRSILGKVGLFSIRNNICVFVYRNGRTYLTRSKTVIENLQKAGYREGFLWVPLSDHDDIIINPDYANIGAKVWLICQIFCF